MNNVSSLAEPTDKDWKVPVGYERASPTSLIGYWKMTVRKATGQAPRTDPRTQIVNAEMLIAKIGYKESIRTLAFMAMPISKYYQYPYSLAKVVEAYEELKNFSRDKSKTYTGFLGPVGLTDLSGV